MAGKIKVNIKSMPTVRAEATEAEEVLMCFQSIRSAESTTGASRGVELATLGHLDFWSQEVKGPECAENRLYIF